MRSDLPDDRDRLTEVLIAVVGAGNPGNIDGLGGGNAVTTKVAMFSRSDDPEADVDHFFAQVAVEKHLVDCGLTCGNILISVGPAAIEMGLLTVTGDETRVRIRAVNHRCSGRSHRARPGGAVRYDGDVAIDGVPGTAAPVVLDFMEVAGSRTGKMLPTGQVRESINGIEVSCIDVAMPVMIGRATDLGITGYESQEELDENNPCSNAWKAFASKPGDAWAVRCRRSEDRPRRRAALGRPPGGALLHAWTTHPTLAMAVMSIEHPMGSMDVTVNFERGDDGLRFASAGVVRTARLIARGDVMVPAGILKRAETTT